MTRSVLVNRDHHISLHPLMKNLNQHECLFLENKSQLIYRVLFVLCLTHTLPHAARDRLWCLFFVLLPLVDTTEHALSRVMW